MEFLYNNSRYNTLLLVFRTFLETYVDFILLSKDKEHVLRLIYKSKKEEHAMIQALLEDKQTKNVEREILVTQLNTIITEISEIEIKNKKDLTIKNKFEKSGLIDVYKTIYNLLCSVSHNNVSGLVNRYLDFYDESKVILKIENDDTHNWAEYFYKLTSTFLIDSLKVLNKELFLSCDDILSNLEEL